MHDRWEYTIPANTAEADAIRVKCGVSPGTLRSLIIFMPRGCQNLARCRVFIGERPVAPRSMKNFIACEGYALELRHLDEPIQEDLPVLNWDVWNIDETWPHTIWMSAEWTTAPEPYEKTTARSIGDFVSIMKRLIGVRGD